jgi:hypothetical protein
MGQPKITTEPTGQKDTGTCACCGHSSRCIWGFAYKDRACVAAYFVHWTVGHMSDHGANFDKIIGPWGDGASAADRSAVGLAYRITETGRAFMVIDARARPLADSKLIGQALDRDQVLGTSTAQTAFDTADAILAQDPRIAELLGRAGEPCQ